LLRGCCTGVPGGFGTFNSSLRFTCKTQEFESGPDETRTRDLCHAKAALSQLSYGPKTKPGNTSIRASAAPKRLMLYRVGNSTVLRMYDGLHRFLELAKFLRIAVLYFRDNAFFEFRGCRVASRSISCSSASFMASMKVSVGAVSLPLSKGCRYLCQGEGL
jgi:hypothetical protein